MTETAHHGPSKERLAVGLAAATLTVAMLAGALAAYASDAGLTPTRVDVSALEVFRTNITVLGGLALGLFTGGLATVVGLLQNGLVFGYAIAAATLSGHGGAVATGVGPHLLPELGGFVVGAGADLWLGATLAGRFLRRRALLARGDLRTWLRFQGAAVLLLAIGAIIEAVVSHV